MLETKLFVIKGPVVLLQLCSTLWSIYSQPDVLLLSYLAKLCFEMQVNFHTKEDPVKICLDRRFHHLKHEGIQIQLLDYFLMVTISMGLEKEMRRLKTRHMLRLSPLKPKLEVTPLKMMNTPFCRRVLCTQWTVDTLKCDFFDHPMGNKM